VSPNWVPFDVADADPDPLAQFETWFAEGAAHLFEPSAVALATADEQGQPSVRMVLLRHHGDGTFGWYTNYDGAKGHDLAVNPTAALLWYCEPLGRQIRVEGEVRVAPAAQSDAYFAARPRGHQLGAHASAQSQPIASRDELAARVAAADARFPGEVPRPANWGGHLLTPTQFEFWQHRSDRLHDRVVYQRDGDAWRRERWMP